ncbi:D-2-hydroxyacid dehydrogenase [Phytopseudomonas dryadis]|uniref:D-2-hydroxyacid dehydrogenase n=1 Tax=Phytopseudomonas dryadis TaxID=2487520 RepID=A0A4Q9R2J0_9GAMM|nr:MULTISPECIES: D-2-hydroxyacid dehydrogenase [Pseudomonas]TBU93416.1 D-2-hydroxyacid dehydrogenase [Pseudomonas dryadis]TBV07076.1 D-2-hydroxyacid dehydrogenase [Pseudomonas dryadis]TBV19531.1 D-2-hydroxyacid dehydrogenase [Pseudomonas sp. FRB 230]
MRVLIAEADHDRYRELLQRAAPQLQLVAGSEPAELAGQAADCPVWLGEPDRFAELLRGGLRPQWLQSTWAGITPLLADDLPRDYLLSRAVGVFGQVMAEYVLGHMLAHERQLLSRLQAQREQRWDNRQPRSLAGRRVVIVGAGEIGVAVAGFLQPFGVELRGIASSARTLAPFAEVAGLQELPRLAAEADYLVNLLPNTPATCDVYDAALFARLKPSAVFINAGRGTAVVDEDLVAALAQRRLAAAVIDVCREEPLPAGHPFWTADNLLLTGHSAAPTPPARLIELFLGNLQRYRDGTALQGQVDFTRGY